MNILNQTLLVNYDPIWIQSKIEHEPWRRQLTTLDCIHDEHGQKISIQPHEIIGIQQLHWNNNLAVYLSPINGKPRIGYIDANSPWKIECYSPTGETIEIIQNNPK